MTKGCTLSGWLGSLEDIVVVRVRSRLDEVCHAIGEVTNALGGEEHYRR